MPGVLSLQVRADSFLYRMVRILGGAIVAVGNRKMELEDFTRYLDSGAAKPCAEPLPARGLFLWRVTYPPETLSREPGLET
jgi:tRNA pseudouridine38-40 synthase